MKTAATLKVMGAFSLVLWAQPMFSAHNSSMPGVMRGNALIGDQVRVEGGRQIGEINDLVLDLTTGRLLYAVLDADDGAVAVPPGVFTRASGNTLRVDGERQQFRNAPRFTRETREDLAKADFVHRVYQHFSQPFWWQGSGRADQGSFENVHRLTQLQGMQVKDTSNRPVAKVNNVAVDLESGRILYVLLEADREMQVKDQTYPVPPDMLTPGKDKNSLTSNLSRELLERAPAFEDNRWQTAADTTFATQVYKHYGKKAWFDTTLSPTGRSSAEQVDDNERNTSRQDQRSQRNERLNRSGQLRGVERSNTPESSDWERAGSSGTSRQ